MADPTPTPTDEQKARIDQYGVFAGASVTVDNVKQTVKVRIEDPLKGKDYIEFGTDTANAAFWAFNDIAQAVLASGEKIKKAFSG